MTLTKQAIQTYIEGGGVRCPYCQAEDIEGDSVEIDEGTASQEVRCHDCGKGWVDCYSLTSIAESED